MKRLQAEWKTIGPVKKSRSEALWQRFRGAADHFFARYAQRHDIALGERVAAREAICAELEALAAPVASRQSPVVAPSPDGRRAGQSRSRQSTDAVRVASRQSRSSPSPQSASPQSQSASPRPI